MKSKKIVLFLFSLIFLFFSCVQTNPEKTDDIEKVVLTPDGGLYTESIEIEFSCKTENVDFYYSLDKPLYLTNYSSGTKATSVKIEDSCVVYVIAVSKDGKKSSTARAKYTIQIKSEDKTLNYLTQSDFDPLYSVKSYSENSPLYFGNPSNSTDNIEYKNNFLLEYNTFALSYNNELAMPNWVSWHLTKSDRGSVVRSDSDTAQAAGRPGFHPDENLPESFVRISYDDYTGSGFDRGHQCPSADRTNSESANDETYVMTNMCPQTSQMNGGTWGSLEDYERDLLNNGANEVYIFAGPAGIGGTGRNGIYYEHYQKDLNHNKITIPKYSWKIILVLADGTDDMLRVNENTRIIAALIPNTPECLDKSWNEYRVSVDYIEEITGYDFFSELPDEIENAIESKVDNEVIPKDSLYSIYYPSKPEFSIGEEILEEGKTYYVKAGTKVHLKGYPVAKSVRIYYGTSPRNLMQYDAQPSDKNYVTTYYDNESSSKDIIISESQILYAQVTSSSKDSSSGTYKISSTSKESFINIVVK